MLVWIYELKDQSKNNEEKKAVLINVFEVVSKERLEHPKNPQSPKNNSSFFPQK